MTTAAPHAKSERPPPPAVPDEEDVARWAAFFDSLPADEREALDELGREIGARLSKR